MILNYVTLLLAIPLGLLAATYTRDEKSIYMMKRYFPTFLVVLTFAAAIFFFIDKVIFLTLVFTLILIFTWSKA